MRVQEYVLDPCTIENFVAVVQGLHREKLRLERALIEIKERMNSYSWLEEGGRGSYEWDDDRYYEEIGHCFDSIRDSINQTMDRTSHSLCCDTFGHINPDVRRPVQMSFKMYEDFPAFEEDVLKVVGAEV